MKLDWDIDEPHIIKFKVGSALIDILGHVNNAEYLKWMEQVAWSHCEALDMTYPKWKELGFAWVARHSEIDYLLPAFENDNIYAGTWIAENDQRISTIRKYQLIRESDGKTLARGWTKWICINLETGKASKMPKQFIDIFPANNSNTK